MSSKICLRILTDGCTLYLCKNMYGEQCFKHLASDRKAAFFEKILRKYQITVEFSTGFIADFIYNKIRRIDRPAFFLADSCEGRENINLKGTSKLT